MQMYGHHLAHGVVLMRVDHVDQGNALGLYTTNLTYIQHHAIPPNQITNH